MKRALSMLLAFSMLISISANGFKLLAQQPKPNGTPDTPGRFDPSEPGHDSARKLRKSDDLRAKSKAAWDKATPEEREQALQKFKEIFAQAQQKAEQQSADKTSDEPEATTLAFVDKRNRRELHSATKSKKGNGKIVPAKDTKASDGTLAWRTLSKREFKFVKSNYVVTAPVPRHKSVLRQSQSGTYATGAVECGKSVEQFVRDLFQSSLGRQPDGNELSYWANTLTGAQGQAQLIAAAQNLGNSLFQSPEYAARSRSDYDYVYDLYKAFLQREPDQGGWDFWANNVAQYGRDGALNAFGTSQEFQNFVASLCTAGAFDADGDSLPDSFENQLADEFTPFYHVSAGETDNFATFYDSVPQTVKDRLGQNPASHFRVKPLGFGTDRYGNQVSIAQIDYFTLWDHDSGLDVGGDCYFFSLVLGLSLHEFSDSHYLDNERSAILVAAPTTSYNTFNTDASAYSAYEFFTTGHEGIRPVDQTLYFSAQQPVHAGGYSHIENCTCLVLNTRHTRSIQNTTRSSEG